MTHESFFSNSTSRLKTSYDELTEMLKNEDDLKDKDEYIKALSALKEAELQLP